MILHKLEKNLIIFILVIQILFVIYTICNTKKEHFISPEALIQKCNKCLKQSCKDTNDNFYKIYCFDTLDGVVVLENIKELILTNKDDSGVVQPVTELSPNFTNKQYYLKLDHTEAKMTYLLKNNVKFNGSVGFYFKIGTGAIMNVIINDILINIDSQNIIFENQTEQLKKDYNFIIFSINGTELSLFLNNRYKHSLKDLKSSIKKIEFHSKSDKEIQLGNIIHFNHTKIEDIIDSKKGFKSHCIDFQTYLKGLNKAQKFNKISTCIDACKLKDPSCDIYDCQTICHNEIIGRDQIVSFNIPPKPTILGIILKNNIIKLQWDKPTESQILYYIIIIKQLSYNNFNETESNTIERINFYIPNQDVSQEYNIKQLNPSINYKINIIAKNTAGYSELSNTFKTNTILDLDVNDKDIKGILSLFDTYNYNIDSINCGTLKNKYKDSDEKNINNNILNNNNFNVNEIDILSNIKS